MGYSYKKAVASGSGTPATTVTDETTFAKATAVGVSTNYAREDHSHGSEPHDAHANTTGITATDHHVAPAAGPDADITVDVAGAAGTASTFARSGHGHQVVTSATAAVAVGTASAGTSGHAPSRDNHVHPTGAGTPSTQAFGDAAAVGTGPAAAMTDHKHGMPSERAASSITPSPVGTATVGTGTTDARSDHIHATGAGTPTTSAVGDAAATGAGPAAAMTNHVHGREAFATPVATTPTALSSAGVATTIPRSDHSHQTPGGSGALTTALTQTASATNMTCTSFLMPANFAAIGTTIRFTGWGLYTGSGGTPATHTYELFDGSAVLVSVVDTPPAAGPLGWKCEAVITCKTTGGSGTWLLRMEVSEQEGATGALAQVEKFDIAANGTTKVISTTSPPTLTLRCRMTTAVASNVMTVELGYYEIVVM